MKRVAWSVLFLVMGVSCLDQPDCYKQNVNLIGISFKKMSGGKADTLASLQVLALGWQTDVGSIITGIALPLNYLENQTEFSFIEENSFNEVKSYSLSLSHDSKAQFVSEECGGRFVVSNLNVLSTNFDSVRVVSRSPSSTAHTNIIVYRCPRNNFMRFTFRQYFMDTEERGKVDVRQVESITTSGTTLYENKAIGTFLLPLNPNSPSSSFDFKFSDGDINTITFNYLIEPKTIFKKCGEQNIYTLLDPVSTNFEIIKIVKNTLQDPPVTNIEAFRCPVTNTIKVLFKQLKGSPQVSTDTLFIFKNVRADYLADALYSDVTVASIILPLNPNPAIKTTKFTFELEGGATKTLQLNYDAVTQKFHDDCGDQTVFSALKVDAPNTTGFTTTNILDEKVNFPVVNNIETIQ